MDLMVIQNQKKDEEAAAEDGGEEGRHIVRRLCHCTLVPDWCLWLSRSATRIYN